METLDKIKEKIKSSTDNEYILESLKANEKLQGDREVMLAAVKVDGQALYYGSKSIRNDKEIVLEAVKKKGLILKYASYELREDKEIALAAVKQDKRALEYIASEELKQNPDITILFTEGK